MTVEDEKKEVIRRLKEQRIKAKMSQFDLAIESGVSQNMIAYIENGQRVPTLTTLLKMCTALKISPTVLFEDTSEEIKEKKQLLHELIEKYVH